MQNLRFPVDRQQLIENDQVIDRCRNLLAIQTGSQNSETGKDIDKDKGIDLEVYNRLYDQLKSNIENIEENIKSINSYYESRISSGQVEELHEQWRIMDRNKKTIETLEMQQRMLMMVDQGDQVDLVQSDKARSRLRLELERLEQQSEQIKKQCLELGQQQCQQQKEWKQIEKSLDLRKEMLRLDVSQLQDEVDRASIANNVDGKQSDQRSVYSRKSRKSRKRSTNMKVDKKQKKSIDLMVIQEEND